MLRQLLACHRETEGDVQMSEYKGYWSRRRFLKSAGTAGVGAAAIGLVGCGDDDDDDSGSDDPSGDETPTVSSGTPTVQPKTGGKYLNIFEGYQGNADPHLGSVAYHVTSYMGDP